MPTLKEHKDAMGELAAKASRIAADSTLSNSEKKAALDQLQEEIKDHSDAVALHEQAKRIIHGADESSQSMKNGNPTERPLTFGEQVVLSAGYKSMIGADGAQSSAKIEVKATNESEGVLGTLTGGAGDAGQLVLPQALPGIVPLLFQPLRIADLLAQGSTDSSAVSYVIEAAFNDTTATVAEGGTKPQLDLTLARRQDPISKIANTAKVTDEMFQDASQFQAYLQNRMTFGIQRAEENQLLNGNGTAPNLQGILQRTGLAPAVVTQAGLSAQKAMEGIFNQITYLRAESFVEPDGIVMHPTDWQTIRLGKDGQGQYYGGGPFTGAYGNPGMPNVQSLWGYPLVVTTAIAQGTVLVGGFRQCAQIFRRQGVTLEMTNSNVDDFVNNLITIRAEERLGLAVYRPAGFGAVTLTA